MSPALLHWEDFPAGERVEIGQIEVSRAEILAFARAYDPQPFHLDEEAARASILGGLCASGWHVAALMMRLICDAYLLRAAARGEPSMDEMRWMKPVYVDDRLTLIRTALETRLDAERPDEGLVQFRHDFVNQNGVTTTSARHWQRFARRSMGA